MSISSPKRPSRAGATVRVRASGFGPQRLAEFATRRPGRVLAVWGVVVLVSLGLTGTLLGSGLTSDSSLTNHPESDDGAGAHRRAAAGSERDRRGHRRALRAPRRLRSGLRRARACAGRRRPVASGSGEADLQLPGPGRQDPGVRRPARHGAAGRGRRAGGRADRRPHLHSSSAATAAAGSRRTSPAATRSIATSRSSRRAT